MATSDTMADTPAAADDPTDLTRTEYVAAFKRTLKEIKDDDVPGLAAGVAFKIFLSLFPSLVAAVAIFGLVTTVDEMSRWLGEAGAFLPRAAVDLLERPLLDLTDSGGGAGLAAVTGVAAGAWAAMSAAISLMKALSRAYDVAETRTFVRQRLVGLALTVALLAALVAIVLLLIVGRQVQEALLGGVPPPLDWLLVGARFALALVVLILLFAFVYWIGPDRDQPSWVWISPGAVFGVIGWLAVSGAFTIYAQNFGNYEAYGAIAGVAVLLIWLQLTMLVILVGAEFNAEVERTRGVRLRVREGAGFAATAPAAALAPDATENANTVRESEVSAHTIEVAPGAPFAPASPPVGIATSSIETSTIRRAGTVAATLTAVAAFLGFARRRPRR